MILMVLSVPDFIKSDRDINYKFYFKDGHKLKLGSLIFYNYVWCQYFTPGSHNMKPVPPYLSTAHHTHHPHHTGSATNSLLAPAHQWRFAPSESYTYQGG